MRRVVARWLLAALLVATWAGAARADVVDAAQIEQAEKAARQPSASVDDQLRYARVARMVFRFDDARGTLELALKGAPNDVRVLAELARVDSMAGRMDAARSHAQRALSLGDDAFAAALVERLGARARIARKEAEAFAADSPEALVAELMAALAGQNWDRVSALLPAPAYAGGRPSGPLVAAYATHLAPITGVHFVGYEVGSGSTQPEGKVRVRMLWRVDPGAMDVEASLGLPAVYRALLPLDWLTGLGEVSPDLRNEALGKARSTSWSQVTLATARVEGGKVVGFDVGGADLLRQGRLDLPTSDRAPTAALGTDAGPSRREMFKNRYGKSEPAKGEPYMWRQILFALVIVALAGIFLIWLVRRETKGR